LTGMGPEFFSGRSGGGPEHVGGGVLLGTHVAAGGRRPLVAEQVHDPGQVVAGPAQVRGRGVAEVVVPDPLGAVLVDARRLGRAPEEHGAVVAPKDETSRRADRIERDTGRVADRQLPAESVLVDLVADDQRLGALPVVIGRLKLGQRLRAQRRLSGHDEACRHRISLGCPRRAVELGQLRQDRGNLICREHERDVLPSVLDGGSEDAPHGSTKSSGFFGVLGKQSLSVSNLPVKVTSRRSPS
jgi:hypothetical protein